MGDGPTAGGVQREWGEAPFKRLPLSDRFHLGFTASRLAQAYRSLVS
ncbi:MAG: hypothetical protein QGH66_05550 [Dehalococcoidia bacterium]|nr:hypothetical protein [Dehalococcoidia bacterium]